MALTVTICEVTLQAVGDFVMVLVRRHSLIYEIAYWIWKEVNRVVLRGESELVVELRADRTLESQNCEIVLLKQALVEHRGRISSGIDARERILRYLKRPVGKLITLHRNPRDQTQTRGGIKKV